MDVNDVVCEVWKDILGYEGYYQVSNLGRVRSLDRIIKRRNSSDMIRKGTILRGQPDKDGYLLVGLKFEGREYKAKVHRLVAQAFIPNPENKPFVNHIDGNKDRNDILNLEWVTALENSSHAKSTGLLKPAKGEDSGKHKLSEQDVLSIRKLVKSGKSMNSVAKMYGVSFTSVRYIIIGKNWAWLKGV